MNRYQRIHATEKQKGRIAGCYGVTTRSVHKALIRETDSELARSIRRAALSMGCVDMILAPHTEVWVQEGQYLLQETEAGDVRRINLDSCVIEETLATQAEPEVEDAEIINEEL